MTLIIAKDLIIIAILKGVKKRPPINTIFHTIYQSVIRTIIQHHHEHLQDKVTLFHYFCKPKYPHDKMGSRLTSKSYINIVFIETIIKKNYSQRCLKQINITEHSLT